MPEIWILGVLPLDLIPLYSNAALVRSLAHTYSKLSNTSWARIFDPRTISFAFSDKLLQVLLTIIPNTVQTFAFATSGTLKIRPSGNCMNSGSLLKIVLVVGTNGGSAVMDRQMIPVSTELREQQLGLAVLRSRAGV